MIPKRLWHVMILLLPTALQGSVVAQDYWTEIQPLIDAKTAAVVHVRDPQVIQHSGRAIDRFPQLQLIGFELRGQQNRGLQGVHCLVDRRADPVAFHDHIHRSGARTSPVEFAEIVQVWAGRLC